MKRPCVKCEAESAFMVVVLSAVIGQAKGMDVCECESLSGPSREC